MMMVMMFHVDLRIAHIVIAGTTSTCPLSGEEIIDSYGLLGVVGTGNYWFSIGMVLL
jgi:hypothetical protein